MEGNERKAMPWVKVRFVFVSDYEGVQRCVRLLSRRMVMRGKADPWGAERRSQASLPFDGEGTMDDGKLMEMADRLRRSNSKIWLGNVSGGNLVWPKDGTGMATSVLSATLPDLFIANGMDPEDMEWVACMAGRNGIPGARILFFRPTKEGEPIRPWQRGMLTMDSIVSFRRAFAERADLYVKGTALAQRTAEKGQTIGA